MILYVSNPNTPVLYASNTVDITKDIIDIYDKQGPGTKTGAGAPNVARPPAGLTPAKPLAAPPPAPAKKQ